MEQEESVAVVLIVIVAMIVTAMITVFIITPIRQEEIQEYKIYKCPVDVTRIFSCEEIEG